MQILQKFDTNIGKKFYSELDLSEPTKSTKTKNIKDLFTNAHYIN